MYPPRPVRGFAAGLATLSMVGVNLFVFAAPAAGTESLNLTTRTSQPTYVLGQPITLTATVTNRSGSTCSLSTVPDGALRVLTMTRDGIPVSPTFGSASYLDGYPGHLRGNLTPVPNGRSVAIHLEGMSSEAGGTYLASTQPLPAGATSLTAWPLDQTGAYQVSMRYQVPRLASAEMQPCTGTSGLSTVDFSITTRPITEPSSGTASTDPQLPWFLAALAGTVGLVLLVLAVRFRSRHRRSSAAALLLLVVLGGAIAGPPRPSAAEVAAPRDAGLNDAVQTCLNTIKGAGGPSAEVAQYFDNTKRNIVVTKVTTMRQGQQIYDVRNYATVGGGHTVGRIWWSPLFGPGLQFSDGVAYDPCAALLHELSHIRTLSEGKYDPQPCNAAHPVATDEVRAVQAENTYRRAVGLKERTTHNNDVVPPDAGLCDHQSSEKDKAAAAKSGCSGLNTGCGRTRGDPHLKTFDNLEYDFQAAGEFVTTRSTDGRFEIQTRQIPPIGARAVTLNTAVAARVGRNRIHIGFDDGQLIARLNGRIVSTDTALPGGGGLTRRTGWSTDTAGGWSLTWPDRSTMDVDPFGDAWLDISIAPAATLAGKLTGLLGDYDGNADNDLAPRTGRPLPPEPDFDSLYRSFGDSWRVTADSSLFAYRPGESIASFADRSVPNKIVTAANLTAADRDRARQMCSRLGVTAPHLLDDCTIDVAHTGQAGFAVSTAVTEHIASVTGNPDAIRDGSLVRGQTNTPGEARTYDLDLGGANDFAVADWHGPKTGCHQSFSVNLVTVSGNNYPCEGGMVRFHVPDPTARYQLEIAALPDQSGEYGFTLITTKIRRHELDVGGTADGVINVRGEQHWLQFNSGSLRAVRLTGVPRCPSDLAADLYDISTAQIVTGRALCGSDAEFMLPDPGHRYAIIIRSDPLSSGSTYHLTLASG